MADSLQLRSQAQIIGRMVETFLSRLDTDGIAPGLSSLKPGSPYLAIFEGVGQAIAQAQQQNLMLLNSDDLDRAKGDSLDRIGRKERLPRRGETYARGSVTISDTSFVRVATRVYQGKPAPIAGVQVLYAADGSQFPATGRIYIGRGTSNVEGPLSYSAVTQQGSAWVFTLTTPTQRAHNVSEVITLAQGGDRVVSSGQVVSTPQGNYADAAKFVVSQSVTLLDGETFIEGVPVLAEKPGRKGNVGAAAIRTVESPAFSGMAVTNPRAFANALDIEDDDHYRARIKSARQTRQRATKLAIESRAYGIQATDESSTITSTRLVQRQLLPSLLVIDDGLGYEPKRAGVAYEVLADFANGGEKTFFLTQRPVAQAAITSGLGAPFALRDGATLALKVGGQYVEHSFDAEDFRDIAGATAYEVAASINKNPVITFAARTSESGTKVSLVARAEEHDDIEVVEPVSGSDANAVLGFPYGRVDTLRLYRNDRLLHKDGSGASITAAPQTAWRGLTDGETLVLDVDGTGDVAYHILDADFANFASYGAVSEYAPLEAWASVINQKVAGVTASVVGSTLVLTSNRGASSRASLSINASSSLVAKGVFDSGHLTAVGRDQDYVLNRNLGQVELVSGLKYGDKLTVGTPYGLAYLETATDIDTVSVPAGGANLWVVMDGATERVRHSLTGLHHLGLTADTKVRRFTGYAGPQGAYYAVPVFSDVQVGDWAIFTRGLWSVSNVGAYRVSRVAADATWFEVEVPAGTPVAVPDYGTNDAYRSLVFVRSSQAPQRLTVAAGIYTPQTLASALSSQLRGGAVGVYDARLRLSTFASNTDGEVALVAQDDNALMLGFATSTVANDDVAYALLRSGNSEVGTPLFDNLVAPTSANTAAKTIGGVSVGEWDEGVVSGLYWLRATPNAAYPSRFGSMSHTSPSVLSLTGTTATLDSLSMMPSIWDGAAPAGYDRLVPVRRFSFGPESYLNLVLDDDAQAKSYSVPMFRRLKASAALPYGRTIRLLDLDNLDGSGNPQALDKTFGTSFDFSNFVLHARARAVTHQSDATRATLWRLNNFRGYRAGATVAYAAPALPGQPISVTFGEPDGDVYLNLPSGARRAMNVAPGALLLRADNGTTQSFVSAFAVTNFTRNASNVVTVTMDVASTGAAGHSFAVGGSVYVNSANADFPPGAKTLVAVSATTISYSEVGNAVTDAAPANAGVSRDAVPVDFSAVRVNDYLSVANFGAIATRTSFKVTAAARWYVRTKSYAAGSVWTSVASSDDIQAFPISTSPTSTAASALTVAALVAGVNGLTDPQITGTLLGTGAGSCLSSGAEDATYQAVLADGLLHIGASVWDGAALNYTLTLKKDPAAALVATPNDWANEEFRLVPATAKNVASYLGTASISGLDPTSTNIKVLEDGAIQFGSDTAGSAGSIKVTGGAANELRYEVSGAATISGGLLKVPVRTSDLSAVANRSAVLVRNSSVLPKANTWNGATTVQISQGRMTIGGGSAWAFSDGVTAPVFGSQWLVEKVGKFAAYTYADRALTGVAFTGPAAGDWVNVMSGKGACEPVGALPSARRGAAIAVLQNGKVLAVGGTSGSDLTGIPSNTAALYDPATATWTALPSCTTGRSYAAAVTLADGRVFVCGGMTAAGMVTASYEIFDPVSATWTGYGAMGTARALHTATLMSGGEVAIIGGISGYNVGIDGPVVTNTVESYNPSTNTVRPHPSMATARANHTATRFGDDRILVAGGTSGAGLGDCAVYSFVAEAWSPGKPMQTARQAHVAADLGNGFVLLAGGSSAFSVRPMFWTNNDYLASAEVFDTNAFATSKVAPLVMSRAHASAVKLLDGTVLVVGGRSKVGQSTRSAEVYDPNTGTWGWAGGGFYAHEQNGAALLPDGKVLLAGRVSDDSVTTYADSEVFNPNRSTNPSNTGVFRVIYSAGNTFWVENDKATSDTAAFGLVGFHTYSSAVPGDSIQFGTSLLGSVEGNWTVGSIDYASLGTSVNLTGGCPDLGLVALGNAAPFVKAIPAQPGVQYHEVQSIIVDPVSGYANFFLGGALRPELVTASAGSVIEVLDRLAFPIGTARGQDGYQHATGLIAEANRVLYGDEADSVTYPGYIAAGANINISAPLIRRVKVRLAIRERSGANAKARVQAAVARVINGHDSTPIAISEYLAAAEGVDGVLSVVPVEPVPTTSADTIPVQPDEKAVVLDPDIDIQVSVIGA